MDKNIKKDNKANFLKKNSLKINKNIKIKQNIKNN